MHFFTLTNLWCQFDVVILQRKLKIIVPLRLRQSIKRGIMTVLQLGYEVISGLLLSGLVGCRIEQMRENGEWLWMQGESSESENV